MTKASNTTHIGNTEESYAGHSREQLVFEVLRLEDIISKIGVELGYLVEERDKLRAEISFLRDCLRKIDGMLIT